MRPNWTDLKKGDLVVISYDSSAEELPKETFISWVKNLEDDNLLFTDCFEVSPGAFLDEEWGVGLSDNVSRFSIDAVLGNMDKDKIYSFMTKNYPEYFL